MDSSLQPATMRTAKMEERYQNAKLMGTTAPLHLEPHIYDWRHWYGIANRFPYDMVFREHDMILPRREVATREQLNMAELTELQEILREMGAYYDIVFENFMHKRSNQSLYHIHVARFYEKREQFKI